MEFIKVFPVVRNPNSKIGDKDEYDIDERYVDGIKLNVEHIESITERKDRIIINLSPSGKSYEVNTKNFVYRYATLFKIL